MVHTGSGWVTRLSTRRSAFLWNWKWTLTFRLSDFVPAPSHGQWIRWLWTWVDKNKTRLGAANRSARARRNFITPANNGLFVVAKNKKYMQNIWLLMSVTVSHDISYYTSSSLVIMQNFTELNLEFNTPLPTHLPVTRESQDKVFFPSWLSSCIIVNPLWNVFRGLSILCCFNDDFPFRRSYG